MKKFLDALAHIYCIGFISVSIVLLVVGFMKACLEAPFFTLGIMWLIFTVWAFGRATENLGEQNEKDYKNQI